MTRSELIANRLGSSKQKIVPLEQIQKYFRERFKISEKDWSIFQSKLKKQTFAKATKVINAGEVENYLSFIENGIVRFYIPGLDNDLTFGFVFSGAFFSAYDSFLTQRPSDYYVETLTETTLWRLTYEDLQQVYAESEIGNLIGRKASEELFLKKSQRELALLNNTAEERYLNLFSERPELFRQVPLKYIASYIGVTPQALSRIRKRIS